MAQGEASPGGRHEAPDDVKVALLAKITVVGVVAVILVLLATYGLFRSVRNRQASLEQATSPYAASPEAFIGPELQVSPSSDLRKSVAEEQAVLSSYGWVDRDQGIVHIPIDRAMDLLLERGLPHVGGETTEAPR
jgi:hypothetical protein